MDAYDIARFWAKVDVRSKDQCWIWVGYVTADGYGQFSIDDRCHHAHRVAYEIINGLIEEDGVVRHDCDTRRCCNPFHMKMGSHSDNVADRVERERSARGEQNGRAKLTEEQVRHIRLTYGSNELLARTYRVSPETIKAVRSGRRWKHI